MKTSKLLLASLAVVTGLTALKDAPMKNHYAQFADGKYYLLPPSVYEQGSCVFGGTYCTYEAVHQRSYPKVVNARQLKEMLRNKSVKGMAKGYHFEF